MTARPPLPTTDAPIPQTVTLPYPPSVNRAWRNYRGITVSSDELLAFKVEAGYRARTAGMTMLHGSVWITLDFYRPRRSGDLDNRIKAVLDALNGIAFKDDSQIVQILARRHEDKSNPRVEVLIGEATP